MIAFRRMSSWIRAAGRTPLMLAMAVVIATVPSFAVAQQAEPALPIVFVHGATGSGAQYMAQSMRWASNEYPNVVTAIDRISADPNVMNPILDEFFDALMARTGATRIYVVAHSQGVAVMNAYLDSSPERAARVAKYIGIDSASGRSPDRCPGEVSCMGIWGRGDPERRLGLGHNPQFPGQGHTEVVGSAESFVEQHRFFTGRDPRTTRIVPQAPDQVEIAGRALDYPANTGLAGATVQIWEVDAATGKRTAATPTRTFMLAEDGNWGPTRVTGGRHYEITVLRDGMPTRHFYFEPFIRSNHLIRLNIAPGDSPIEQAIERSDRFAVVSISRQKEWWGNVPDGPSDRLEVRFNVNGEGSHPSLQIVNEGTAPYSGNTMSMTTFDVGSDGTSATDAQISLGPFVSAIDVFYPAADPPSGTLSFVHHQRGRTSPQVINVPNWPSSRHGISIAFNDWLDE